MHDHPMRIFTGNANRPLAKALCRELDLSLGRATLDRFPDGEINLKIDEDIRGCDVFLVQSTCPPVNDNLMELLMMIDCARRASASRISAIIPYFGYARKDRKDEGRVPITAKLVANMITIAGADRVLTLDLHASQIQGFFDMPVDHLYGAPILADHFEKTLGGDIVVSCADVGSIKLARAQAKKLGTDLVIVDKRRHTASSVEAVNVIGSVDGRDVVLMDDMVTTGGSLAEAAVALVSAGAKSVRAGATHGVFAGKATDILMNAPIEEIVVTDTIPHRESALSDKTTVVSVAPLLGEALRRIHLNESVSQMFKEE